MGKIKFEKFIQEAKLRSPLQGFQEVAQRIEVRKDPLTEHRCRINVERTKRPKQTLTKIAEFDKLIASSKTKCFFCPENLEKSTPMFAEGLPDRIKVGKACLFPNLFPFGGFHAVGVFSGEHYLRPDQFTPKLLEDCFKTCLKYFKLVNKNHPDVKYWHINWNHLPPSAASIIHPHVQIMADPEPSPCLRELLEKSRDYHKRNGSNYWSNLVGEEKASGERFIAETGAVSWLASYAPHNNGEVLAVVSGGSSLVEFEKRGLNDFCVGLSRILKGYHALGVLSFNMGILSGPCDEDLSDFYLLNARVISRPRPTPFYTSDKGFMELFHKEPIIEVAPEDLAEKLRANF